MNLKNIGKQMLMGATLLSAIALSAGNANAAQVTSSDLGFANQSSEYVCTHFLESNVALSAVNKNPTVNLDLGRVNEVYDYLNYCVENSKIDKETANQINSELRYFLSDFIEGSRLRITSFTASQDVNDIINKGMLVLEAEKSFNEFNKDAIEQYFGFISSNIKQDVNKIKNYSNFTKQILEKDPNVSKFLDDYLYNGIIHLFYKKFFTSTTNIFTKIFTKGDQIGDVFNGNFNGEYASFLAENIVDIMVNKNVNSPYLTNNLNQETIEILKDKDYYELAKALIESKLIEDEEVQNILEDIKSGRLDNAYKVAKEKRLHAHKVMIAKVFGIVIFILSFFIFLEYLFQRKTCGCKIT